MKTNGHGYSRRLGRVILLHTYSFRVADVAPGRLAAQASK